MTTGFESQRTAGRIVGFTYLFTNIIAVFAAFYVRGHLIVWDNAAQTAHNIIGSELLFRASIACDLIVFAGDAMLAAAFYVLLKPVGRGLALAGSFFRLADAAILGMMSVTSFAALRLLTGADYLRGFQTDQLQGLARLFLGMHETGYMIGLIFFSIGSTCTSYLLLKSNYIPKPFALLGVFASVLAFVALFVRVLFPQVADIIGDLVFIPVLLFEVSTGIWIIVKGINLPALAATR